MTLRSDPPDPSAAAAQRATHAPVEAPSAGGFTPGGAPAAAAATDARLGSRVEGPRAAGHAGRAGTATEALDRARALAPGFAARATAHDADGTFPAQDITELRAAGLLGLFAPPRLGGCGATFAEYAQIARVLAAGSGATALIFNMHASVTGALAHTSDELVSGLGDPESFAAVRETVLRQAAEGTLYAVAMSERGAGSRLSRLRTRYRRTADGFHITGRKSFVSGAGYADAYLVAAREAAAPEAGSGAGGAAGMDGADSAAGMDGADGTEDTENPDGTATPVSYFLVPGGEGVRVEPVWDALGMRATGSHDLSIDVTVPPDALLGGVEGLAVPLAQVMPQWLVASYSAVYAGVARAAVDAASEQLRERGLESLPLVRARLGRADAAAATAALAVDEAAQRVTAHPGSPETNRWVWRAKLVAGDTAAEVASSVLEAAGASALRRGHPLERLYRDARCGALQPATSDVCADWLGIAALGGDPDRDTGVPRW